MVDPFLAFIDIFKLEKPPLFLNCPHFCGILLPSGGFKEREERVAYLISSS